MNNKCINCTHFANLKNKRLIIQQECYFFLVFYLKCFRFVLLLLIYLTINLILFCLNALCDLCECGLCGCLMLCLDPLLLKLCRLLLLLGFLVRRKGCLFIGIIQLYCFQKLIFFLLVIYLQKEYNQIHLFEFYFHLIIKNYLNHRAMRINYFILQFKYCLLFHLAQLC